MKHIETKKTDLRHKYGSRILAVLIAVIVIAALIPGMALASSSTAVVSTISELQAAFADPSVETIVLGGNITAPRTPDPRLVVSRSVEIRGEGYTLDLDRHFITMQSSGTMSVRDLTVRTTDRFGFFSVNAPSASRAGVWDINFENVSFEGSALAGQRTANSNFGAVGSVTFSGNTNINTVGTAARYAVVYATDVSISDNFTMTGANDSIYFKSVDSSGTGSGTDASGSFIIADGAVVNISRALSSDRANTFRSNLIEGYERFIFGENSKFDATAGTNLSSSNRGKNQTAIIYSGMASDFTVRRGAEVNLTSDHSLTGFPATHGSTALSLRKPSGGHLEMSVAEGAALNITAYGTNARSRSLAPVLILAPKTSGNSGTSAMEVRGSLDVYSRNGNGWYYQCIDYRTSGGDNFIVNGGNVNIIANGQIGRSTTGEYAAFEHCGPTPFSLNIINGGNMYINSNGWRGMALDGGKFSGFNPEKTITVRGTDSELYIDGGQFAIAAEGRAVFEMNVLGGGHVRTRNTQDSNIYTVGQATYNVDGSGSHLEMLRTGVSDDPAIRGCKNSKSLHGVIFHDAPLVGPLTINVTNGGYMSAINSYGSRATITAQSHSRTDHSINVSGQDSTLTVINNNTGNSSNTSRYPVGAIAFAAKKGSGNINIRDGGNFFAESNSFDSPTIALGSYKTSNNSGMLTLDNPGEIDIRNNASTTGNRAIALRGRNYKPATRTDAMITLDVRNSNVTVWPVGFGPQGWPDINIIDTWSGVDFAAPNSLPITLPPGIENETTRFELAIYGRIYKPSVRYNVVDFEANGGIPTPQQRIVRNGSLLIRPANPEKEGYTLVGWYADARFRENAWNFASDVVNNDMTLYAKWEISVYEIRFETHGGEPVPYTQFVDHFQNVTRPEDPFKEYFTFAGWYTSSDFSSRPWDFNNDTATGDMTLYAKWVYD